MKLLLYIFFILFVVKTFVTGLEPVTTVTLTAAVIAGFSMLGKPLYCRNFECCHERWIKPDFHSMYIYYYTEAYGSSHNSMCITVNFEIRYRKSCLVQLQHLSAPSVLENLLLIIVTRY